MLVHKVSNYVPLIFRSLESAFVGEGRRNDGNSVFVKWNVVDLKSSATGRRRCLPTLNLTYVRNVQCPLMT